MQEHDVRAEHSQWPPLTPTHRPWVRWWWMGSAVTEAELTRHLELFHAAGFGGVEISPLYGVTGAEKEAIPFLSPRWIEMLRHTLREARRLDLGVDLIAGTGWPFGGPWVSSDDAAQKMVCEIYRVDAAGCVPEPIVCRQAPDAALIALVARPAAARKPGAAQILDLLPSVDARRRLAWTAPDRQWNVYALFHLPTGQQVKRAAPGGAGNVVDHFSAAAITRYLDHFNAPLAALAADEQIRCIFNDSYEVYEANCTPDLFAQFVRRRGYDLHEYVPALCGDDDPDIVRRVRSDYRQTIAELLLHDFVQPLQAWAGQRGALLRHQAHGSPGNLLDLYAAADIPETETFGPDWTRLAGLAPLPGTPPQQGGRADMLIGKFASSAAHVAGRPLCSSESFTWLDEHGKVPLAHMKGVADVMFVMGINHVLYHGAPFSPAAAAWPGWMMYATTHVAPTNPFWRDLPALNAYISRCQSLLQCGVPDNDLLLYFPIADLWASEYGAEHLLHFLTVHSEHWLDGSLAAFANTARTLWERGYSFDVVSDQMLAQAIDVVEQRLQSRGGSYTALVIAGCTTMPPETLERIVELGRAGATIIVVGDLPRDVPGLAQVADRLERLHAARSALDTGRILIGPEIEPLLHRAGVERESIADTGIELIRRRDGADYLYFLANLGQLPIDQWVRLSVQAASVLLFDPLTARRGVAWSRPRTDGATDVYLQLAPGETLLLRAAAKAINDAPWSYFVQAAQPLPLQGAWRVAFIEGGPKLPPPVTIEQLTSWTAWPDDTEALRSFSGTARYTIRFAKPATNADAWAIALGTVLHSAQVWLNGQSLDTLIARPFRCIIPGDLLAETNLLEIDVTNLMANRLAFLDRRQQPWQKFFFVNIEYQAFDASDWEPLPSGLLGPVQLVPLRRLSHVD